MQRKGGIKWKKDKYIVPTTTVLIYNNKQKMNAAYVAKKVSYIQKRRRSKQLKKHTKKLGNEFKINK